MHDVELPKLMLPNDTGIFKTVIGTYEGETSKIKTFTPQFLYHLKLNPGKKFEMETKPHQEYAAFSGSGNAKINGTELPEGNLMVFGKEGSTIGFENNAGKTADILIFGGEPYREPIVSRGPFVMNSQTEITEAYNDYYDGKYGQVDHSKVQLV